jgi:thiol-disulfide isomerase/thioredoxin
MQTLRRLWRDNRWFRWASQVLLVLGVYLGVRAWQTRGTAGGLAPTLEGTTLDGEAVSLAALRGQPVMVHFWATWCGVCRVEEGNIEAVAADHRVLTVATRSGAPGEVDAYRRERGLSAPVILDPDGRLAAEWGVRSLPTSFVLDSDGRIRHVEVGYTTELGLRARLWLARGP